jgi:hypothetical protein
VPVLVGQRLLVAEGLRRLVLLPGAPEATGEVVLLGVAVAGLVALRPGRARELPIARVLV